MWENIFVYVCDDPVCKYINSFSPDMFRYCINKYQNIVIDYIFMLHGMILSEGLCEIKHVNIYYPQKCSHNTPHEECTRSDLVSFIVTR